jgi:ferrous iron transport protein B
MSEAGRVRPLLALGGNPNAGKTTLFNALTGSRSRVGNYPGITVEKRVGQMAVPGVGAVDVLDVPGTYSLVARSAEEQLALSSMVGMGGERRPDLAVLCVDASQLVRGLYLVLQVLELGLPVIVVLTMMDEAGQAAPDVGELAAKLGCPVVPVVAPRGQGLDELRAAIARRLGEGPGKEIWHWRPSRPLEGAVARARATLPAGWPTSDAMALWALMSVDSGDELHGIPEDLRAAALLEPALALAVDEEAIRGRYAWLDKEVAPLVRQAPDRRRTERVDRVLIHPVGGLFFFFLIMFVMFQALFAWATPMMDLIGDLFAAATETTRALLPPGLLAEFVGNALIQGVGQVVVFLPQILLLFFFLGLLEDSGYMARVAYLMDRIMRTMNLHGRAFVPILSGFACAVPAIMATRTMERRRDRLLTMMVVPLTTCSARLPVYTLIIASLFPAGYLLGVLPVRGLMMVFMYAFGLGTALLAAVVLSRAVKPLKAKRLPFVIELPPYRLPRLRDVLHMMWERSRMFLSEAGTVILVCSVVIWGLLSFPREAPVAAAGAGAGVAAGATTAEPAGPAAGAGEVSAPSDELQPEQEAERIQHSYAGRLGKAIEPALEPLGFDWKIGVGLIGAFAAREVFISTMGIIYGMGQGREADDMDLRARMKAERRPDGTPVYTPLVGLTLMIFFSLCCQCMSTLAVVRRETASWRWPLFLFTYMTTLAWVVGVAVYQAGRALGFQ